MDKQLFFDRFIESLKKIKGEQDLDNLHDSLIFWIGSNYFLIDGEDVKDRIVTDSHAEGIDAILIDKEEHIIYFVNTKSVESFDKTSNVFSENDIKLALEGLRLLIKGDYKGKITPKLQNLTDEFHELAGTGDYETKLIFLTLKKEVKDNKFINEFINEFKISVDFLDFDKIYNFYLNEYLFQTAPPPKRISLEIVKDIMNKDSPINSRVFTCKGKDLARIYQEHGETIFQQNVRNRLTMKSKSINSQIMETASDKEKSKNFWYFNNGITMVCRKIIDTVNRKSLLLDYPQIINGAQTTYALNKAFLNGALKEDVEIILKVIENNEQEFIDNVTLYTNSQNSIKLRDLCSNDKIQIKLQKTLLGSYNYFYERKRGEFEVNFSTEESRTNKFGSDYKHKVLSNEKLAQSFLALFLNKPAEAKSGKGRIFIKEEGGFYKEIFDEKDVLLPEKFLLSYSLLKYIEENKKNYSKKYKSAESKEEKEKLEIYSYDFLLHSEYFILNLFKDFLKNENEDFITKNCLLDFKKKTLDKDEIIEKIYNKIIEGLKEFIAQKKQDPKYYHNKFFKNEKSIVLARAYFKSKYNFFEEIV